ncbi:MAG: nucleotidyltransferase family protein [Planctomycetes bacterium]|nr:nucleotidyltransferase family protein [Planctomycetota bacterium]
MQTSDGILSKLSEHAEELHRAFSVDRIGLFGSYVHGSASRDSDVDILVELSEPSFDHYMDLKFYLENLLGTCVDLVLADTVKPRLRPIIAREVVYAKGL